MMRDTMIKYRPRDYASLVGRLALWAVGVVVIVTAMVLAATEIRAWMRNSAETGINLHYVDAASAMCHPVAARGREMARDGRVTQDEYDAMQALMAKANAADPGQENCQVPVPNIDYR